MLKVECPACRAPYQIDERRVPAAGLKMRCPKCGHSFTVQNPAAAAAAPPKAAAQAPPREPARDPARDLTVDLPAAKPVAAPARGPVIVQKPVSKSRTMIGVPAPSVADSRRSLPSDFPAALGSLDEVDLPVVSGDGPAPPARKPSVAAAAPKAAAKADPFGPTFDMDEPSPFGGGGPAFGELDLESALPAGGLDLPSAKRAPAATPRAAPSRAVASPGAGASPAIASMPAPRAPSAAPSPDFSFDLDLPSVAADLPSPARTKGPSPAVSQPAPKKAPPAATAAVMPSRAPTAPTARPAPKGVVEFDMGGDADLPSISAGLPAIAAGLPAIAASLPSVASNLPQYKGGNVERKAERAFGEIDLPMVQDNLPVVPAPKASLPSPAPMAADPFGDFGELELPGGGAGGGPPAHAAPISVPPVPSARNMGAAFGELDLGGGADEPLAPPSGDERSEMQFRELDLGGSPAPSHSAHSPHIATEAPIPTADSTPPPRASSSYGASPMQEAPRSRPLGGEGGFEAPLAAVAKPKTRERPRDREDKKRSGKGVKIALGVVALITVAGAALQLTPHGAFGHLTITDKLRASEYDQATTAAVNSAQTRLSIDTYDEALGAMNDSATARQRMPRARALSAYAAFVEYAVTLRFGPDAARPSQAKTFLMDLPPNAEIKYLGAAIALEAATRDDWEKAKAGLEAAGRAAPDDPIHRDIAALRGEVELRLGDPKAALASFTRAAELNSGARAQYGIARAHLGLGDIAAAKKSIDATLAVSPKHIGARLLRAELAQRDETLEAEAQKSLASILEGDSQGQASVVERATAFALRGWLEMQRGDSAAARVSFDESLKLDARNVTALRGQGEFFFRDTRFTESLTRYEAALQIQPAAPASVEGAARALIKLERLPDAKTMLAGALEKHPKNPWLLALLGTVEGALGNAPAAEEKLRASLATVDPTHRDAVFVYVGLSMFLSSKGKTAEAQAVLDDAKKKLPDSAALQRALAEVAEAEGKLEASVVHYRAALEKDPKNAATRFRIAVVLRKLRKFEESAAEFDKVQAVDKDFPGLPVERGLLYEASGNIEKAIEQFKSALAKAPDDLDLQLRVGAAYVTIGRPDDALPMLKKVLEKRQQSGEANHYMGRAHMLRGRVGEPEALKYLKRAVDLDVNKPEYHLYLGWMANDATPQQLGLAREEIQKALALDKQYAEAYWQLGILERKSGAIDNALRALKHALELKPTRFEVHAALAEVYEDKNDVPTALAEWTKAVAADERRPYWQYRLGKILFEHGHVPEAYKHLSAAVPLAEKIDPRPPWFTQLLFNAGEASRKSGKKAEAVQLYKRFLEIAPTNSPDRAPALRYVEGE